MPDTADMMDDLTAYMETKESVLRNIRDVEARLALIPNIKASIDEIVAQGIERTPELIHKVICNASRVLRYPFDVENDLAMEWYSAYAAWADWQQLDEPLEGKKP